MNLAQYKEVNNYERQVKPTAKQMIYTKELGEEVLQIETSMDHTYMIGDEIILNG